MQYLLQLWYRGLIFWFKIKFHFGRDPHLCTMIVMVTVRMKGAANSFKATTLTSHSLQVAFNCIHECDSLVWRPVNQPPDGDHPQSFSLVSGIRPIFLTIKS